MNGARAADPAPEVASRRLAVVNGLRGIAIVAVIYHHLVGPFLTPFGGSFERVGNYVLSPYTLLTNAWMGVNLFFVLSGFVLALPYETGERSLGGFSDVRDFLLRRAKRLLPLYYFCLVLALFIEGRSRMIRLGPPAYLVRLLTFTFIYYEPQFLPGFDIALWSLGVEVTFSLLLPLLLFLRRRVGIGVVTGGAFLLSLAVRVWAIDHHDGAPTMLEMVKDGPLGRLDDFVLGIALCRLYVAGRLPSGWWSLLCVVLGTGLLFVSAAGWDNVEMLLVPYRVGAFLHDATNVGFGLVLMGFLGAPSLVRRLLTLPPLQLFGMMCYSLYVWHVLGLTFTGVPWPFEATPRALLLVFLLSAMTYRYIEFPRVPFRKLFLEFPR